MKLMVTILGMALLAATGCSAGAPAPATPTASPQAQPTATVTPTAQPASPSPTSRATEAALPSPANEVPQALLNEIMEQTANATGVNMAELRVVQASAVTWSDGSLGCPEPDVSYIQVLVDGYWVVLEAGGETYDFRADSTGTWKLCPAGVGRPPLEEGY